MTAVELLQVAKIAATMQNALPGSMLGKVYGRQQKAFNSVKGIKPMKFKGESVSGIGKPPSGMAKATPPPGA